MNDTTHPEMAVSMPTYVRKYAAEIQVALRLKMSFDDVLDGSRTTCLLDRRYRSASSYPNAVASTTISHSEAAA